MGKIFLVRHGQTVWNLHKRLQGQKNSRLTQLGKRQASKIAKYLRDYDHIDLTYSSPLDRSRKTAKIIAQHFKTRCFQRKDFNEMSFGELEGQLESEVSSELEKYLKNKANYQFPGGENYDQVLTRVKKLAKRILFESQKFNVLIVGHQAVNRAILGSLLNLPKDIFVNIDQSHHHIFEITQTKMLFCHDIEKKKRTSLHPNYSKVLKNSRISRANNQSFIKSHLIGVPRKTARFTGSPSNCSKY